MIGTANQKTLLVIKQESAASGATLTSDKIDTRGHDFVKLLVFATTSNNATNNPSVLTVREGDSTSSMSNITELVGDTTFTIPNSPTATTTAPFAEFNITLNGGRKRYLDVLITPATTQTFSVVAQLGRSKELPVGTTQQNAAVVVNV